MNDLAAFLSARLDEDEAAVRARCGIFPSPGVEDNGAVWLHVKRGGNAVVVRYAHPVEGYGDMADLRSWADADQGWTQDRVLREVEAKRRILAEYERALERAPGNAPLINALIRLMQDQAFIYSDHPDYREEWAS